MKLNNFSRILLLGYGLEGKSSQKYFEKNFPNIALEILENITSPLKFEDKVLYVISPGIDRNKLCKNIPPQNQTSNTELFFDNLSEKQNQKIIGISGTKGKSTTTKFLHEFLQNANFKTCIGGNYGKPLLDILPKIDELDFVVAELSSFQLENLQKSPYFAIFLNAFGDHLSRHKSLQNYLLAKQNLWQGRKNFAKFLVLSKVLDFSKFSKNTDTKILMADKLPTKFFVKNKIYSQTYWRENFGTVREIANLLKLKNSEKILEKTATKFVGLPHRLEFFSEKNGIKFYDDSIATTPETSCKAIEFFAKNLGAIILGGRSEGGDFDCVFKSLLKNSPQTFIWLPKSETRAEILTLAKKFKFPQKQIILGQNFKEILEKGFPLILSNSAIVLSSGAKSFDNFLNYKIRGENWKKTVLEFL